ncbi:helix-turn-helix domain-containing protein [Candidatus Neomarinimicrobiota bacterium]
MLGGRIRRARLATGLTLDQVVSQLGKGGFSLTKAALSKYENERSTPKPATLIRLASVLNVRAAYFLEDPVAEVEWLGFRRHSQLAKKTQDQIMAYSEGIAEKQYWLMSLIGMDTPNVLNVKRNVKTMEDAESIAVEIRSRLGLGEAPIDSIVNTLEDDSFIVIGYPESEDKFDGLSGLINEQYPVVIYNMAVPDDRKRYTLAHELGHLILNCEDLSAREVERVIHRFAAAFLVTASVVRKQLGNKRHRLSLDELSMLKLQYGLSMQGWIRRAKDLGIISNNYYTGLCAEFNRRGWRKNEPVQYSGREEPVKFKKMVSYAVTENVIAQDRASNLIPGISVENDQDELLPQELSYSAQELLKQPAELRSQILQEAAIQASSQYDASSGLMEFDAFGEQDLYA